MPAKREWVGLTTCEISSMRVVPTMQIFDQTFVLLDVGHTLCMGCGVEFHSHHAAIGHLKGKRICENTRKEERNIMTLGDNKTGADVGITIGQSEPTKPAVSLVVDSEVGEVEAFSEPMQAQAQAHAQSVEGPVADALRKRWEFWSGKLSLATDEANVEAATDALERIKKEAAAAGVELHPQASGQGGVAGVAIQGTAAAGAGTATGKQTKKVKKTTKPKSVQEAEKVAQVTSDIRASKLAEQTAGRPVGGAAGQAAGLGISGGGGGGGTAVAKPKVMRPCLDGCGTLVAGKFHMGHDAKLKSLLIKVEKGELPPDAIPEIVQGIVKLKKGEMEVLKNAQGVTTGQVQHYTIMAAPVRFPNRPEIEFTDREKD